MKENFLGSVVLAGIIGLSSIALPNVEAASWHKGTPVALRGTWTSKWKSNNRNRTKITKTSVLTYITEKHGSTDTGKPTTVNQRYKYLGKHIYEFKGTMYSDSITYKIKYFSKHKIEVSGTYLYR